jgi:bifunctional UDP-N-acetylglucosamine pyrophosphorylase / glucosamine-1-phosphate N-acetyltransferase
VATPEQLAIREYNVSAYCFDASWLWSALQRIPVSPKGEYYLTDAIGLAVAAGFPVESLVLDDPDEAIGLNTRVHLAEAELVMRRRINEGWMLAGLRLLTHNDTYIEAEVRIGRDSCDPAQHAPARPNRDRRGL